MDYLCISADDIRGYSPEILCGSLHDTLRRFVGVQFTLSLTAEGDDRPER